ncbi:hypothetical protein [Flavobacterium branchiicola]|uniref:Lipoprotein n=1 Tax=Flavobacterium branchiicola TaxID=1114875 RepID=A0ABV9PHT9_9FLAO|nr:hypothetical protein [Flavobacterium branchiicola]MBS7256335.1 hypothetical protein [Flavobacterium branchiicola]
MRNKFYKIGFFLSASMFMSLVFVSCTNDEIETNESASTKLKVEAESSIQKIDSTKLNSGLMNINDTETDGDPSNPKPPRK